MDTHERYRLHPARAIRRYHLYGIIFGLLAALFALTLLKTRDRSFLWLSLGMLCSALAWGSTQWQNVGQVHLDWGWWWAQPLFVGGLTFLSVGAAYYLPLPQRSRRTLIRIVAGIGGAYLAAGTLILLLGVQFPRLWLVPLLTPAVLLSGMAALYSERIEPRMGHALIGIAQLSILGITLAAPLLGMVTSVIRLWTGAPLVFIGMMTLTISLLRERQKLLDEIIARKAAELKVLENKQLLERRVEERTLDLQEIIGGLESFNRDISHDLRGPLGSIDMLSYLAREFMVKNDLDSAQQRLREISHLARNTHASVDALLSLARAAEQNVSKTLVDLDAVAQTAAREAQMSAQGTAGALPSVQVLPLGKAKAHRDLMRIILLNLIGNSLKFNRGQPQVRIVVGRADAASDTGSVCLYVQDTGVGFRQEDSEAVFEPFARLPDTAKGTAGHGIGLSIVRRAVLRHQGEVWIRTSPGEGTTVYFTLGPQD